MLWGSGHKRFVDLIICKVLFALFLLFFLPHTGPDIRIDGVGGSHSPYSIFCLLKVSDGTT